VLFFVGGGFCGGVVGGGSGGGGGGVLLGVLCGVGGVGCGGGVYSIHLTFPCFFFSVSSVSPVHRPQIKLLFRGPIRVQSAALFGTQHSA